MYETPVFHNVGKARGMGPRLQLTASNFDAEKEGWGQPTPLSWAITLMLLKEMFPDSFFLWRMV